MQDTLGVAPFGSINLAMLAGILRMEKEEFLNTPKVTIHKSPLTQMVSDFDIEGTLSTLTSLLKHFSMRKEIVEDAPGHIVSQCGPFTCFSGFTISPCHQDQTLK